MKRLVAMVCVLCAIAVPVVGAGTALDYTRSILEETKAIVASSRTQNQKLDALSVLFRGFLDTNTMGRAALGEHWTSFTPSQRREFLSLFREMMERTYVQKLLLFENPSFEYLGQNVAADGATVVNTAIVSPKDKFRVDYRLRREGDRWTTTEIEVEGVSLTSNFHNQFNRVLAKSSASDLLDLMRRKFGGSSRKKRNENSSGDG